MGRSNSRATRVETAVKEHAPDFLAYFARRVEPGHDAADLLAETLLTVWRRAASLPSDDSEIRPWMFGVARRVLMHHYRSVTRQRALADRLRSILSVTPHPGLTDDSEYDDLRHAVATLDVLDREIIGLVHWEGFSLVEASRILKMKESTVRSRYHRAKANLRDQLNAAAAPLTSEPAQTITR